MHRVYQKNLLEMQGCGPTGNANRSNRVRRRRVDGVHGESTIRRTLGNCYEIGNERELKASGLTGNGAGWDMRFNCARNC
jgi:hypothetical protein